MTKSKLLALGFFIGIGLVVTIDGDPAGALRGYAQGPSNALSAFDLDSLDARESGAVHFAHGDFSALSTDTLRVSSTPWVFTAALLALRETGGDVAAVSHARVRDAYRRYGFNMPESLTNWPDTLAEPNHETPLGLNIGFAGRLLPPIGVTVANLGCAACHSGVVYGPDGMPDTSRVWLGGPNTSINLEGYTGAIFAAMLEFGADEDRLWSAVDRLFPELGWRERITLGVIVLPELQSRVQELNVSLGRAFPFRNGLPGATNGLDALNRYFGFRPDDEFVDISAFDSIPDLGERLWRSTALNTANYGMPEIARERPSQDADIDAERLDSLGAMVAFFPVPSMGVTPEVAESSIPDARKIIRWLQDYEPQPYPGELDPDFLETGREVFAKNCAECHGRYAGPGSAPELVAFPNWLGDVGTDGLRARLFDQRLVDAVNGSLLGTYIEARVEAGYAAPPLAGLWSSAPYLHNGSVPTLWHLMHPDQRPAGFRVGGHALDLNLVGIAGELTEAGIWDYRPGYRPWSDPVKVDTSLPGLSNRGHADPFVDMDEAEKRALLEFLKAL